MSVVQTSPSHYRRDIDGLRGLAVLLVVMFHAGFPPVSGGFIGVDVFFVISGYLISRIICGGIDAGNFTLTDFYVRRVKRILPALLTVLFFTGAVGYFLLLPSEHSLVGKHSIATLLFASNLSFFREAGYFDGPANLKPLLMTWSLGIEEQFYLFWPLLLQLLFRSKWNRKLVTAAMTLGSLGIASYQVYHGNRETAFFLLPSRAWELLVGACLAQGLVRETLDRRINELVACVGLSLILFAAFAFKGTTPFPGYSALFPVLGTACLIYSGQSTFLSRFSLQGSPITFLGKISYSLYLWHWPFLSLARIASANVAELEPVVTVAIVGLSFIAAILTYKYVETPFRTHTLNAPSRVFGLYAGASSVMLCFSTVILFQGGHGADLLTKTASGGSGPVTSERQRQLDCELPKDHAEITADMRENCIWGDKGQSRVFVWGDSHAFAISSGFEKLGIKTGFATEISSRAQCFPSRGLTQYLSDSRYDECTRKNTNDLSYVQQQSEIKTVVLAGRWALYLYADSTDIQGYTYRFNSMNDSKSDPWDQWQQSLSDLVDSLTRSGKKVILIGHLPELSFTAPDCHNAGKLASRAFITKQLTGQPASCAMNWNTINKRGAQIDRRIEAVAKDKTGVCTVFPQDYLCDQQSCFSKSATGTIYYRDDDHLSVPGAQELVAKFDFSDCLPSKTDNQAH